MCTKKPPQNLNTGIIDNIHPLETYCVHSYVVKFRHFKCSKKKKNKINEKKNETTLKFTNKWSHIKDANSHFSGQCKNLIKKKLMIHYHILKLFTF